MNPVMFKLLRNVHVIQQEDELMEHHDDIIASRSPTELTFTKINIFLHPESLCYHEKQGSHVRSQKSGI